MQQWCVQHDSIITALELFTLDNTVEAPAFVEGTEIKNCKWTAAF